MRSKKAIFTLLVVSLALAFHFSVHAEDGSTAATLESPEPTRTRTLTSFPTHHQETINETEPTRLPTRELMPHTNMPVGTSTAEFRTKISQIKDERKKTLVEQINNKIPQINKNVTDRFTQILDRFNSYLDRLSTIVNDAKSQGKSTASAEEAIGTARSAVTAALSAVQTQASKTYTIQLTSATVLKSDVGKTISQLEADLRGVYKLVNAAKDDVIKAAVLTEPFRSESISPEASHSAN